MNQLGSLILHVTFVMTFATAMISVIAAVTRRDNHYAAARSGVYAVMLLFTATAVILVYQLLNHDFSNKYVAAVGERAMPWYYKVAAFWGSETGALLFWTWLLSIFSASAVRDNRGEKNRELMPWVILVLMLGTCFFNYLMVFKADPFTQFMASTPPIDGRGVNPLLRHPLMTIHPPCLLLGFMGFTVPFAFGVAAIVTGRLGDDWLMASRKYTIISWTFLSVGLLLGGMWAYQELGWGGFWMWDPVENAALIPWFTGTAFLHSAMIQERRNMFRRWNVFLVFLTFLLTIFGTFLTRSQIIKSIHSFSASLLGIDFLIYCIVILVVGAALMIWRFRELKSENTIDHFFSRESFFILNNWLLVAGAAIVIWGTLFPKISDLESVRGFYNGIVGWVNGTFGANMQQLTSAVDLGESWFNKVMAPLGMLILLLTGIGPLISWRKATFSNVQRHFLYPALASGIYFVVSTIIHVVSYSGAKLPKGGVALASAAGNPGFFTNFGLWWGDGGKSQFFGLLCIAIAIFVLLVNFQEFYRGSRLMKKRHGSGWLRGLFQLVSKQRRRYGGYIIHIGVVCMYLGFAGMAFQSKTDWSRLHLGDSQTLGDYRLTFVGSYERKDDEKSMLYSRVAVTRGDDGVDKETSARLGQLLTKLGFTSHRLNRAPGGPLLGLSFTKPEEVKTFRWLSHFTWSVSRRVGPQGMSFDKSKNIVVMQSLTDLGTEKRMRQHYGSLARTVQRVVGGMTGVQPNMGVRYVNHPPRMMIMFANQRNFAMLQQLFYAGIHLSKPLYNVIATDSKKKRQDQFYMLVKGVGHELIPAVFHYEKHEMTTSEVAIWSRLAEDLYLTTKGMDTKNRLILKAFVNPMVSGMWLGGVIMVLGALIALWPRSRSRVLGLARRRREREKDHTGTGREPAPSTEPETPEPVPEAS